MSEHGREPAGQPARHYDRWIVWAVGVATFLVFARIMGNDFLNVDDPQYLMDNPHINKGLTLSGLWWALTSVSYFYWHPLTWVSHMIDCTLFGLRPWGHHLTNVLLHSANAALAYYALWKLTRNQWASVLTALIFAWHPLRVESVAWAAERKDVLSVFFFFWTLIFYERWAQDGDRRSYWRAVAAMLCAVASKPSVITLPFVLLLLDYWPLQRREGVIGLLLEKWPFAALSVMSTMITVLGGHAEGAVVPVAALSMTERVYNGLLSYTRYIGKMVVPLQLAVYYPYEIGIPFGVVAVSTVFVAGLAALFLFLAKRRPYLLTGWLWYLGTLIPMLGLVQAGAQARADRFTYIPMFGLVIMFVWLITGWTRSKLLLALPLLLGYLTYQQIGLWRNSVVLFTHTLQVTPTNPFALVALGSAKSKIGDTQGALSDLEESVRAQPDFVTARSNLGSAYLRSGMAEKAAAQFQQAIKLDPSRADYVYLLGVARMQSNQIQEASQLFQKALSMNLPTELGAQAHNNIGLIQAQGGNMDRAMEEFQSAARTDPLFLPAHRNVVALYVKGKKRDQAVTYLESLVQRFPDQPELRQLLRSVKESDPAQ